jgi:hypothetical protein
MLNPYMSHTTFLFGFCIKNLGMKKHSCDKLIIDCREHANYGSKNPTLCVCDVYCIFNVNEIQDYFGFIWVTS